MPGDGDLGHLKRDVTTVAQTFAPILIGLSFRVVIDQSLIGSGVANVRLGLSRLSRDVIERALADMFRNAQPPSEDEIP